MRKTDDVEQNNAGTIALYTGGPRLKFRIKNSL
jgi:hypothetical protein